MGLVDELSHEQLSVAFATTVFLPDIGKSIAFKGADSKDFWFTLAFCLGKLFLSLI
jgi:hypothetical protein